NTNGDNQAGSVSITSHELDPWWEVDLGQVADLDEIVLWNRTDCCSERLRHAYVFVSADPFESTSWASTIAQAGVQSFHIETARTLTSAHIAVRVPGRYVRVQ